ncbi:MAG: hypothetical protein GQ532_16435 [Methylomarinum sp.]|nr:hypothetical protein [Methylomarinum sp.]
MLKISGSKKDLKQTREADQASRDTSTIILNPDQIQGKDWTTSKVLQTTLGLKPGESARNITKKDLLAFNANIKALRSKVKGGISPSEVISFSTKDDKTRSRQQIHTAVPYSMKGGHVYFLTDAGPDSDVARHNVHIILSEYEIGLAMGTPLQAAKQTAKGKVKFDCSCKHHTFVFRYISTTMGANSGRPETGFPKIRNPYLTGIACKHVLRVMVELDTSIFIWKRIAKMIEADRLKNAGKTTTNRQKTVSMTQKEANELAKKQASKRRSLDSKRYKDSESDRESIIKAAKSAPKHKIKARNDRKPVSKSMDQIDAIYCKT